ncbi:Variant-specific surface protein, partial [Giardia duodenalis]
VACVRHAEEDKTDKTSARVIKVGAQGNTCEEATSGTAGKCLTSHCDVTIGGSQYCSQCSKNDDHLVDGKCVAAGEDANSNCVSNNQGSCTSCANSYFMYQGGCYQTGNQNPGNTLCTAASNGKCTQAAAGYFVPPGADNTHQSVVSCGDAANGVTLGDKKYVGVADCAKCNAPGLLSAAGTATATCTECAAGFLHTPTGSTSCVSKCPEGYFEHTDSNTQKKTCQSCSGENAGLTPAGAGVAGCAACTYDSNKVTCTKCGTGKYLKTAGDSTSCVTVFECVFGFFPKNDAENGNKCVPCGDKTNGIVDCKMCSKNSGVLKCSTCKSGKKPNTTGTACVACNIANCANCNEENVCEMCTNSKKLSPLKDACLTDCPAGTYDSSNVCTSCHTSCAECNGNANQDSCTACYPGSVLNRTTDSGNTGTCIPECTGKFAENCEKDMCTAVLGGSKYCSKCVVGYAPIDGVCTAMPAGARDVSGCTASGGKCTACTGANYALLSSGCYNTKALPGSAVCTQAGSNGQCQTCANGQQYTSGNCPACAEGCSACNAGQTQQCTKCLAGCYLDSTAKACKKCSENSNGITGISNCVSCAAPTGNHKLITCCPKIDSSTIDTRGDGVDKNIFSTSVITSVFVLPAFSIGGLAEFLVSGQPITIAGRYLLEETDPSTVYKPASLCDVPT